MILLPISVQKLLEQEIPPVRTFMSNLHCSVRGQKKETPPAAFGKKIPPASGSAETNTSYGIVDPEHKSSPG